MKTKSFINVSSIVLWLFCLQSIAQTRDYRKDSLQFKMYTRMYVNDQLGVDSIRVKKIFCDYCNESQIEVLTYEAIRQSKFEINNPRYRKPGEHRLALYVRFSKEDFKKLKNTNE